MNRKISSEYGQIKIHRRVIRQIAETAARQIAGVKAAGWDCYGYWALVLKFFNAAGTRVVFGNQLKIVIPVVVVWNTNIVDIAYEVQKEIITHMLNGLNIDSLTVDVKVKRVERG
ncbi:MAG: Asp23/Gls24 family envelope stress response protein [Candidatus Omnitrophota bacterium]